MYVVVKKKVQIQQYDDYTIEDYFREKGAQIGVHNRIMIRNFGEAPYLIRIGNHCTITSGVELITHDGGGWVFTEVDRTIQKFGTISILDNCFIGLRTIVLPNVTIGPNSIVGAGSVVTKDIPANTVVAGNPARVISTLDDYIAKIRKTWEMQKPSGYMSELKSTIEATPITIHQLKQRDYEILKAHLMDYFNNEEAPKKLPDSG